MVLTMPTRTTRRKRFKRLYESLGLNTPAEWAPAIIGDGLPVHLRWLKGYIDAKKQFDSDKPGKFACFLSHLAIMRESYALCDTCDLIVFEDDIVFVPDFK